LATLSIVYRAAWLLYRLPWPPSPSHRPLQLGLGRPRFRVYGLMSFASTGPYEGTSTSTPERNKTALLSQEVLSSSLVNLFHAIQMCLATPSTLRRSAWLLYRTPWPPYPCYNDRRRSCIDCLGHPAHPIDLGFANLPIIYRCAWPPHPSYAYRLGYCIDCLGHPVHAIQIGVALV
jgi:hypothetical protein